MNDKDNQTEPGKYSFSMNKFPLAVTAYLLLFMSAFFCSSMLTGSAGHFLEVATYPISGNYIFFDNGEPAQTLKALLGHFILPTLFKSYFTGVYLILIPGLIVFILLCLYLKISPENILKINLRKKTLIIVSWGVCLALFAFVLFISYGLFKGIIPPFDEFSYLFQSKLLLQGKLFMESPPMREFFQSSNIINNGRLYSKYTLGWPLLLTPGTAMGIPFVINALLSIGSLILVFNLGKLLYDEKTGRIAAIALIMSPFFILYGATLMSHTSTGFFAVLLVYAALRGIKLNSPSWSIVAGIAGGILLNIRPADAALTAGPLFLYLAAGLLNPKDRKERFKSILLTSAGFFLGAGFLAIVNYLQNGSPLKMSFLMYNPNEKWGFSTANHTIYAGIWNDVVSVGRMLFWAMPLFLEFSLTGLLEKKGKCAFAGMVFAAYLIFFLGYYSTGGGEFGSRFFFVPYLLMSIPAARGIIALEEFIGAKTRILRAGAYIIIPALAFASIFCIYPRTLKAASGEIAKYGLISEITSRVIPPDEESLIFLMHSGYVDTANLPGLKEKNVRAVFLDPEKNMELIKARPNRKAYLYRFDMAGKENILEPYPVKALEDRKENRQSLSWAYFNAALNYDIRLKDPNNAARCFKEALKYDPGNLPARINLAQLYYKYDKYDKALEAYLEILRDYPDLSGSLYYLGRIEGNRGNYGEAVDYLERFVQKHGSDPLAPKAMGWIRKYSGPAGKK